MTTDPIWQAFTETGDPLYYLLYRSVEPAKETQAQPKDDAAALPTGPAGGFFGPPKKRTGRLRSGENGASNGEKENLARKNRGDAMKQLFYGGVHPAEHKELSEHKPIRPLNKAPAEVVIPMSMHIGAPCKPVVAKGDTVMVGQVIGETAGLGAPIHASVSGFLSASATSLIP